MIDVFVNAPYDAAPDRGHPLLERQRLLDQPRRRRRLAQRREPGLAAAGRRLLRHRRLRPRPRSTRGPRLRALPLRGRRPPEPLRRRARRAADAERRLRRLASAASQPGATVEYRGITVGEVDRASRPRSSTATATPGARRCGRRSRSSPPRLGVTDDTEARSGHGRPRPLAELEVDRGLRAQLAAARPAHRRRLYVDLAEVPDAAARHPRPRRRSPIRCCRPRPPTSRASPPRPRA